MPRFFIEPSVWQREQIVIEGEDARHIGRVLRMQPGDTLVLCDGQGHECPGVIDRMEDGRVLVSPGERQDSQSEPNLSITLLMALPKGEKMEWIVQKSTELGVTAIQPVLCERCVSRPDGKALEKKTLRWQRVAYEAAKQSGRGRVPQVLPALDFAGALASAEQCQRKLFFYEKERERTLRQALEGWQRPSVAMLIGPEGGFEETEVRAALEHGFESLSLGKRILRCETAPLAAISAVLYHYHNF